MDTARIIPSWPTLNPHTECKTEWIAATFALKAYDDPMLKNVRDYWRRFKSRSRYIIDIWSSIWIAYRAILLLVSSVEKQVSRERFNDSLNFYPLIRNRRWWTDEEWWDFGSHKDWPGFGAVGRTTDNCAIETTPYHKPGHAHFAWNASHSSIEIPLPISIFMQRVRCQSMVCTNVYKSQPPNQESSSHDQPLARKEVNSK